MSRTKLQLPPFSFSVSIPIRITDLNYGGHVGNDSILALLHEARIQYLRFHGYTELDLEGIGLIMSDVTIEFRHEIFYGEIVVISVVATDFSKISFDLYYKIEKTNKNMQQIIAVAKTGIVGYNYQLKKVASIPEKVKHTLC